MHTKHRMTFLHTETSLAVLGDHRRYRMLSFLLVCVFDAIAIADWVRGCCIMRCAVAHAVGARARVLVRCAVDGTTDGRR